MPGRIYFVGAGPGDPELITVKGLNIINQSDVILFAGSLVPRTLFDNSRAEKIIDSSGLTLSQTHEIMVQAFNDGCLLARVHTGDPSIYGTIQEQTALLERDAIPYEIIPGVTAAFAAAARAGVSFTYPEANQTLIISRASGRTRTPAGQDLKTLAQSKSSMAIYLSSGLAPQVQAELLAGGMGPDTCVLIGVRIGWADERIIETNLENLADEVEAGRIKGQAVFLVLPARESRQRSKLYDPQFSHGFRQ